MKQDDEIQLIKELAGILERQVELVRHDDIAELDELVGHSELRGKSIDKKKHGRIKK